MGDKSAASVMKEQFALIGMLVVLIGAVYTDSYYSGFGLRYQSLGLPASHILYRGLTAVVDMPFLVVPYVVGVGWLALASSPKANDRARFPYLGWLSVSRLHSRHYLSSGDLCRGTSSQARSPDCRQPASHRAASAEGSSDRKLLRYRVGRNSSESFGFSREPGAADRWQATRTTGIKCRIVHTQQFLGVMVCPTPRKPGLSRLPAHAHDAPYSFPDIDSWDASSGLAHALMPQDKAKDSLHALARLNESCCGPSFSVSRVLFVLCCS
jgi:hypothetical protein